VTWANIKGNQKKKMHSIEGQKVLTKENWLGGRLSALRRGGEAMLLKHEGRLAGLKAHRVGDRISRRRLKWNSS